MQCAISRKNIGSIENLDDGFFDSHSAKHLAKRKNEIGLAV